MFENRGLTSAKVPKKKFGSCPYYLRLKKRKITSIQRKTIKSEKKIPKFQSSQQNIYKPVKCVYVLIAKGRCVPEIVKNRKRKTGNYSTYEIHSNEKSKLDVSFSTHLHKKIHTHTIQTHIIQNQSTQRRQNVSCHSDFHTTIFKRKKTHTITLFPREKWAT